MHLFGYLTFVGDLQNIPTQNAQYQNEPFVVREICVHTFVAGSSNGAVTPYMRGHSLRLNGRMAEMFSMPVGSLVAVECGSSCRPYIDQREGKWRVSGNLTVSRICQVSGSDIEQINRFIAQYSNNAQM